MPFFNDITLGQYYPGHSFVHRLDPRTKIIVTMFVMTGLLVTYNLWLMTAIALALIAAVIGSRIPVALVGKNLRPFIWLFGITVIIHMFWTSGRVLYQVPVIHAVITREGIELGLLYSFRLGLLIVMAAVLTLTTSPIELTDALEKLAAPLKRLRVPVHEIALMLTLSLRFIPTLMEEAQRIRNAQLSRGAAFSGSLLRRIRGLIPMILPLFVSAFRRADELAMAMDARCYRGGEGRTSYSRLQFARADYIFLTGSTAVLMLSLFS
ncbi:energy-coupling factor transporter transmembrane protein EcfT [candidate division KSB1 bacterium]|nr:energy-coupling factor transporter transmembrane protein EcfT [candidate division KSB1 bacterium]